MLLTIIQRTLFAILELASVLLFVRAILSWFPGSLGGRFYRFIYALTEPILLPFRRLFDRLGIGRNLPIDLSFLAAILFIQLLATLI